MEIEGEYGEVQSVGLRSLEIVTAGGDTVTVPHAHIRTSDVSIPHDDRRRVMCNGHLCLAPDHDARAMRAALEDMALPSAFLHWGKPMLAMLEPAPCGTHDRAKTDFFDLRDQVRAVSELTERGKGGDPRGVRRGGRGGGLSQRFDLMTGPV